MKILFIGSHCDDVELSCGGAILKLKEQGNDLLALTLSVCDSHELFLECGESMKSLGCPCQCDEYPVRNFDKYRQSILDRLIRCRDDFNPDTVFTHSAKDRHQDHSIVGAESLRAFRCNMVSYTSAINRIHGNDNYFIRLTNDQMIRKVSALKCYASQQHRAYFDPSVIFATAQVAGLKCGCEFAEGFEVVKMIN